MNRAIKRLKEPEFEKIASILKLSADSNNWPYEILDYVYTKFDFLTKKPLEVEIKDKEEKNGYGIGAIWIDKRRKLYLPFVVNDFKLSPFDLLGTVKGLVPFNLYNYKLYSSNTDIFKDIKPVLPYHKTSLQDKLTAPHIAGTGNNSYNTNTNTITKHASILTKLASTIQPEKKAEYIKKLSSDPWLKEKLVRTKIASKILDKNYITQEERNKNLILSHAKVASVHKGKLSIISTDPFGHIENYKIAATDTLTSTKGKGVAIAKELPYIKEAGVYNLSIDGEKTAGIVFPNITDLDKKLSMSLIISGKGYSLVRQARGEKIASDITLGGDTPEGFGFFYHSSKGIATTPLYVKKGSNNNRLLIKTATKETKILMGNVDTIEQVDNTYILNKEFKFIKIPNRFVKIGSYHTNPAKEVTVKVINNRYNFSGSPIKIADTLNDLRAYDAKLILMALDATEEQADKIVKLASKHNISFYTDSKFEPKREISAKTKSYIDKLRTNLTKEASVILESKLIKTADSGDRTVDAVLALDFITPENINTFISYLPELEEAEKQLAELTFASRLGLETIPEKAASTAMNAISEVVRNLKILQLYK